MSSFQFVVKLEVDFRSCVLLSSRPDVVDSHCFVCVLVTRPLRGLAVKALRGMPPTLFNRPVQFTNRSITRCLEHAGDRQIFDFTVSGAPGSTYQGRRHAAEALYGEAAKRPSN